MIYGIVASPPVPRSELSVAFDRLLVENQFPLVSFGTQPLDYSQLVEPQMLFYDSFTPNDPGVEDELNGHVPEINKLIMDPWAEGNNATIYRWSSGTNEPTSKVNVDGYLIMGSGSDAASMLNPGIDPDSGLPLKPPGIAFPGAYLVRFAWWPARSSQDDSNSLDNSYPLQLSVGTSWPPDSEYPNTIGFSISGNYDNSPKTLAFYGQPAQPVAYTTDGPYEGSLMVEAGKRTLRFLGQEWVHTDGLENEQGDEIAIGPLYLHQHQDGCLDYIAIEIGREQAPLPDLSGITQFALGGMGDGGQRIDPGSWGYSLDGGVQVIFRFNRPKGDGEHVVLERSLSIADGEEDWQACSGSLDTLPELGAAFLVVSDSNYITYGPSRHLAKNLQMYYRARLTDDFDNTIEQTAPAYLAILASEVSPVYDFTSVIRYYWDDDFSWGTPGNSLIGFVNNLLWNDNDAKLVANGLQFTADGRVSPKTSGSGEAGSSVNFISGPGWKQNYARAKIWCNPATPGLGSGGSMWIYDDYNSIIRITWIGNKVRFETDNGLEIYDVPAGTMALNLAVNLVDTSMGVNAYIHDDLGVEIWSAGGVARTVPIVMANQHYLALHGNNGASIDSWSNLAIRATVDFFDQRQFE